jgi:molybdopterin molybdotransferase
MLPVPEAQAIVLKHTRPLSPRDVPLSTAALGLVLAEDVASDIDMPPFDKALMDGYAVRAQDLQEGRGVLHVIEEITAGQTPQLALAAGQAARIMTGAPIPQGADAVIVVERTRLLDGNRVQVDDKPPRPGQNILARAREMRRGETVLRSGTVLQPQHFGVLATVGRSSVAVHPAPEVAILPTGDEIVEISETPRPGQIRNGNSFLLLAQVARAGGVPRQLGIAPDRLDGLRALAARGLESDVLVLSGGVSAGKLDLVPGVLQELGVKAHFHKVEMKPGKPLFFGTRDQTLVFGLPGNPVSSLVCFELFVRPALRKLKALADPGPHLVQAELVEDFPHKTDRPTYHPAVLTSGQNGWQVRPVPWFGSSDLRGLLPANALVLLPAGEHQHRAGQRFPVLVTDMEVVSFAH